MKYALLIVLALALCACGDDAKPGDCYMLPHVDGGYVVDCHVEPDAGDAG